MVVAEEFMQIVTIIILLLKSKRVIFKVSVKLARARAAIQICGFMEPEPKEIFSAPQHCLKPLAYQIYEILLR
jgi:hypothetical protein